MAASDATVFLAFCSGAVYRYFAVPEPVVEGPMAAADALAAQLRLPRPGRG